MCVCGGGGVRACACACVRVRACVCAVGGDVANSLTVNSDEVRTGG